MAKPAMTLEEFLKIKAEVQEELETAISKAILAFGEDLSGVEWFSGSAETYEPARKAA